MKHLLLGSLLFSLAVTGSLSAAALGNGLKIGEVTGTSAIVWTRLTATAEPNMTGPLFAADDDQVPPGRTLADMRYSLPPAAGEARLHYYPADLPQEARTTPWSPPRAGQDGTLQFELHDLLFGRDYVVRAEARPGPGQPVSATVAGHFRTAAAADQAKDVSFTVITCHDFIRRDDLANGHKIYPAMRALDPDFTVHAGDVEYYDKPGPYAKTAALARYKWNRIFALPFQKDYYSNVAVYFEKDDHDILANDAWPGSVYGDLTWDQGLAIFKEQTPTGSRPYRTIRWGEHLQIWLVEGREFRSPNDMPDGPDKSIWGAEQKAWFYRTFARSDAAFRVLISPTPILGPDRPRKNDNHANEGFFHEGREIRDFLAGQEGAIVICGDRHWQYATVDAERGIREFGCGSGSDSHAGGWRESLRTPEQTYLRIKGGFLRVAVDTSGEGDEARLMVQHYDVDGGLQNEVEIPATRNVRAEAAVRGKGWTPLFDGDPAQFGSFHLYNLGDAPPERWSVIGDVLTLASRKQAPDKRQKEDLVITTRGYQNFELALDWKASVGANGGIFYKVVESADHDKPWHTGLEYQLLDNAHHKEGKIETHRAGDLYDLMAASALVSHPALEWNHTRIVVHGTVIEHWLNGTRILREDTATAAWAELVADSKYAALKAFAQPIPGHIILQDHGDRLWFKDIRIREL